MERQDTKAPAGRQQLKNSVKPFGQSIQLAVDRDADRLKAAPCGVFVFAAHGRRHCTGNQLCQAAGRFNGGFCTGRLNFAGYLPRIGFFSILAQHTGNFAAGGGIDEIRRRGPALAHEDNVLGDVIDNVIASTDYPRSMYHIFLGVYPNDDATIAVAQTLAERYPNVHEAYHFFKTQAPAKAEEDDSLGLDLGIAACHFALGAAEKGLPGHFEKLTAPGITAPNTLTYTFSWVLQEMQA